jgi:hypothetical protein
MNGALLVLLAVLIIEVWFVGHTILEALKVLLEALKLIGKRMDESDGIK